MAGIHRSSTLQPSIRNGCRLLGMAGIHRSSTLSAIDGPRCWGWGWPGFTAQVHSDREERVNARNRLGMAGIHRSSTLPRHWPRCTRLGMAGIHRSSTLMTPAGRSWQQLGMAGIHRSSTLTRPHSTPMCRRWGWPGFTAQVHSQAMQGRCTVGWGWPGFTAQVHLS